jgi:hypothetical protein
LEAIDEKLGRLLSVQQQHRQQQQSLYPMIQVRSGHGHFNVGNLADGTAEISQRLWQDE